MEGAIAKTAATWIAADACGEEFVSLHRYFRTFIFQETAQQLAERVNGDKQIRDRILVLKIWVASEIGKLFGGHFAKLEYVFRVVRNESSIPFGGVQVLLDYDPLQLSAPGEECTAFNAEGAPIANSDSKNVNK
jgi:hypothetical protein